MTQKNIILITVDSLRADHVGCYNSSKNTTPFLDNLAQTGIKYTKAYANGPRTSASFQSILASRYPLEFGTTTELTENHTPIAEQFKQEGYLTAGFHSNPYLSTSYGYDRGFDEFDDSQDNTSYTTKIGKELKKYVDEKGHLYNTLRKSKRYFESITNTDHFPNSKSVNKNIERWISNDPSEPFFLWIHYMDVHSPYDPPDEHIMGDHIGVKKRSELNNKILSNPKDISDKDIEILKNLYDGEIRYVDKEIGNIYKKLENGGLLDNTAMIVTSDHGEEFKEDGDFLHAGPSARKASKLRDELLHVPLIIIPSSNDNQTTIDDRLVSLIDLPPTITDIANIATPDSWKGTSVLEGGKKEHVFGEYWLTDVDPAAPACSIRTNNTRVIFDGTDDNYQKIPEQISDGKFNRLKSVIENHLEQVKDTDKVISSVELSDEQKERLKQLGYLAE
ncbi:sulfatase [Natronorubrum sp. FCH18a]|uniref:sulfatase n=1 Tax=Natronorubrum sp. FCH18a TaxID=3447018 RepID=UPI003F50FE09